MALFKGVNLDNLKKKAGEGIKAVQEGVQSIDSPDALKQKAQDASRAIGDTAKTIGEGVRTAGDTASTGSANIRKKIGDKISGAEEESQATQDYEFAALLSFLAAADGEVSKEEKEKICELLDEIDDDVEKDHHEMIDESVAQVQKESGEFGWVASAKINAKRTLDSVELSPQEKKSFCWNLFAVASADSVSADESDFIRYVCEVIDLDKAIVEELAGYNDAIIELSAEKEKLKKSARSFNEIEPLIREITAREETIIKAAEMLVTDN